MLHGPKLLWPDTLALAADGELYVSVNQLPRIPLFNNGSEACIPPYLIIRVNVGMHNRSGCADNDCPGMSSNSICLHRWDHDEGDH